MVMMNEEGEADMIKGRTMIDSTIRESAASLLSTPILLISDHLKGILKKPKRARKDLKEDQSQDLQRAMSRNAETKKGMFGDEVEAKL